MKVTIIGAGSVGATIAYTLAIKETVSDIVLIDINKNKASGEVMDIMQGTSFQDPINIVAGDYEDAKGSDLVIITSGIARQPGQTRIELTQTNVNIIKDIAPQIAKAAPNAFYIIVSNPVDIITYVFTKISGLPERQILGSGTLLDTARLRIAISRHFDVAQKSVHAYIFGEHGDSSFIPWSCTTIASMGIPEYIELANRFGDAVEPIDRAAMEDYVHKSGGQIIAEKGATFYAVSTAVCRLCHIWRSSHTSIVTVSSMMHGEYGIDDVCISTLTRIGPNGVAGKMPIHLEDDELMKLRASADKLKEVIRQIDLT